MFRSRCHLLVLVGLLSMAPRLVAQTDKPPSDAKNASPVATALWFSHHNALPQALVPGKDRQLKIKLITALGKTSELPWEAVSDVFDRAVFQKLAGGGNAIPLAKMEQINRDKMPQSRKDLNEKTRLHADLLTTQSDLIEEIHRERAEQLVAWIVKNYESSKPLGIICICTRNTRRSMLSSTMGNIAATYYGLINIRFYCGGTDPDAINPRTIATLKEIGLEINKSGKEAPSGSMGNPNPIYHVQWGKGMTTLEFSKKYTIAQNPQEGFAAILVCSEADASCPNVTGASVRIYVPYLDPKAFDGAPFEAAKYAERRDDIGRFMLNVLMQARRRLELDGKLK
jgi:arsenate reductase (thioredoxin)